MARIGSVHGIAILLALGASACAVPGAPAPAPDRPVAEASGGGMLAELERAFWACDYVATTRGVGATPIAACRHATESLKHEKFGGSFPALLEWWRVNKAAEHSKLERRFD